MNGLKNMGNWSSFTHEKWHKINEQVELFHTTYNWCIFCEGVFLVESIPFQCQTPGGE